MKTIFFKSVFLPKIQSGEKTQTIRKWNNPLFKKGDIITVNHNKNFQLKVLEIHTKKFSNLTKEEIQKDGFSSSEELKSVLLKFYGQSILEIPLFIVNFKYIPMKS